MAFAIVQALQIVGVDVGEHQSLVRAPGAFDLVDDRDLTHAAPVGAGEIVQMSPLQLREEVLAVSRRGRSVSGRTRAIRGSLHSVGRRPVAHLRKRRHGSDRPRIINVEVLAHALHLAVVKLRDAVTFLCHAVSIFRDRVALGGLVITLRGDLGPHKGPRVAIEGGLDAFGARELMRSFHLRIAGCMARQIAI